MKIACFIRHGSLRQLTRDALDNAGFDTTVFDSWAALMRVLRQRRFDLILIDMPFAPSDVDSIFPWLRVRSDDHTPTLILAPRTGAEFVALALDQGADDFLVRPFEAVELVARVKALLRRSARAVVRRSIDHAGFTLDRQSGKCAYLGSPIALTPREFSMAWLLFASPGVYVSRETLGAVIWTSDSDIAGRTIEQHVYKLRRKLTIEGRQVVKIRTSYGCGYRLDSCEPSVDAMLPTPLSA